MSDSNPNYLKEMLTSQGNFYAFLGSLAAGIFLSIPFGFGMGVLPLIAFGAGELIAAMYVPSSLTFRASVDKRNRQQKRFAVRTQVWTEISSRERKTQAFQQHARSYGRMIERITSLQRRAKSGVKLLSREDMERLEDAVIEFLCMWLASLVMEERSELIRSEDLEGRIAKLDKELASPKSGGDIRQLQKARADYQSVLERHQRMMSRKVALEAALFSMPDQLEEIYQTLMTLPASEELGSRLDEALQKLKLQEDIETELSDTIPNFAAIRQPSEKPQRNAVSESH